MHAARPATRPFPSPGTKCRLRTGLERGGAACQSAPRQSARSLAPAAVPEAAAAAGKAARGLPDARPPHSSAARAAPLRRGAVRNGPAAGGGGEGRGGTAEPGGRRPPRPATRIAWRQRDGVIPCLAAERFAHLPYRAAAGTQALVRHASVALSRMIKHGRTRQSNDGGEGIRTRAIVCRLSPTINSQ